MDETEKLLYMEDFILTQSDGKTKMDKVINVTGNRVATYGQRVIENLASYKWQTMVEGDINKRDSHKIEEFLNAMMAETNEYLNEGQDDTPDLYTFWAKHVCNRGRIGALWMSWVKNGEYKIHCTPLDMRWTPYVKGKWVAPIYFLNKEDLELELEGFERRAVDDKIGEYSKVKFSGFKEIEVREYWDKKKHELWISGGQVYNEPNTYGILPFVSVVAPSGFMLRGKGFEEHEGEDIYFLIKKLNKELNRSLSIEQTLGMDVYRPPYQKAARTANVDGSPAPPYPETGSVSEVVEGEKYDLIPRGDMNRASFAAREDIVKMMDEGAPMQPRAYTQPPSAVEVATEVELLNQLYNSRVTALQMGLSQLYRLMIDMTIKAGESYKGEVQIGGLGKKQQFSLVQLKDPKNYSVSCRLMTKNTKLEIINEARALALWGRAPLKYILEDILQVEDPAGWERALDLQKAKEADPVINLAEMGVRYAEEAEDMEDSTEKALKVFQSKRLIQRAVQMLKQEQAPPQLPEGEKGNANSLIALTGASARGGKSVQLPTRQEVIPNA